MIVIRDCSTAHAVELVLYRDGWFVCLVHTPIRVSAREAYREALRLLRLQARRARRDRANVRRAATEILQRSLRRSN